MGLASLRVDVDNGIALLVILGAGIAGQFFPVAARRVERRTRLSNFAGKKCLTAILFSFENDT
jgi:hypothetical protein